MSRAETDLQASIKKACSSDETAPKRKHVRSCIVFTWDHKTAKPFFNGLKILPLQDDEVKLFKALITIHKVLQEGHPSALQDGIRNMDWIHSLTRAASGGRNYSRLIKEYDRYILLKLDFHRYHRGFNGTFEYQEYISLRTVSDPNEGYQTVLDLLALQDSIDNLQKLIIASISHSKSSECKISALVPLVAESYGIYKFLTSMLRALNKSTGGDEALDPLRDSFNFQHARLYEFYADCSSIKYLTGLITIPKLPTSPPNLFIEDDNDDSSRTPAPISRSVTETSTIAPTPEPIIPQPTAGVDFWKQQQDEQLRYQEEQLRLEQERQQQLLQQQQLQQQQQQYWLQQQKEQEEAQRKAQELLLQDQMLRQAQGNAAVLERDLLALRGQYEKDQLMLEQYDQRVKALEQEILTTTQSAQQQIGSKDELIASLQEQLNVWKNKYESLAKLYSQLRQEHLNLLSKFKKVQQKAASAQEAIDKREKLEKEIKAKNIELADLIRERDRARLDLDRLKGGKNNEIERLETELRVLQDKLDTTERSQSSTLTSIFQNHNKEIEDLKRQLSENSSLSPDLLRALQQQLVAKDEEIEIMQQTMDEAIKELAESQRENDNAMDEQIDQILVDHLAKLTSFVDSILSSGISRIQEALYELDSPMQAGNQNSSPEFLLSIVEKASNSATDFATSFNNFIADGPNGDHSTIIKSSTDFSSAISGVLLDTKGLTRLARTDDEADTLINTARWCAQLSEDFFENLLSKNLNKFTTEDDKTDIVIESNLNVQEKLQALTDLTEKLAPRTKINKNYGDLGSFVDKEMSNAALAISAAIDHLSDLKLNLKKSTSMSSFDLEINNATLSLAIAVTNAIQLLIQAATDSQNDIVLKNKGSNSRTAFYKKHNRWTEGLISALKLVALSTNTLITTADGVLSGSNSHEELIVASNEVAASTAQLVAASRVKAELGSRTQDNLEDASKLVTSACRSLVTQVQKILDQGATAAGDIDFSKLSLHQNKTVEMEQQVEILKLENALNSARKRLGEIRKYSYKDDDDTDDENEYTNGN